MIIKDLLKQFSGPKNTLDPNLIIARYFNIPNDNKNDTLKVIVVNKGSYSGYNIIIRCATGFPLTLDSDIKVFCNCDNFKFQWAYVLNKHNSLLNPNNGQFILTAPEKTNPKEEIGVCKHVFNVIHQLLNREIKEMSNKPNMV